jgi:hypothetical protein
MCLSQGIVHYQHVSIVVASIIRVTYKIKRNPKKLLKCISEPLSVTKHVSNFLHSWNALASGITTTSMMSSLAPVALYPQWNFFALISARGWVGPRTTVRRQKEYVTWKFPRILLGIEPGTVRLVAASPNYSNNTQTHSILRLLFLPDTVPQCPVTKHNSLCGQGPVTVPFDIGHFRSEGRVLPKFVDTYSDLCRKFV